MVMDCPAVMVTVAGAHAGVGLSIAEIFATGVSRLYARAGAIPRHATAAAPSSLRFIDLSPSLSNAPALRDTEAPRPWFDTDVRRGIFIAPFGELAEPRVVAALAQETEARGWDGFFVWDHVAYRPPVEALADPWVCLSAVAMVTSRVTIGPLVTPLPRRRTHQLARETMSLDRLSGGRLVLGVGIGSEITGEFDPARFGEEGSARERARLLDG